MIVVLKPRVLTTLPCQIQLQKREGCSRGEEVLEAVGTEVHVVHESEEPDAGVNEGLLEALPRAASLDAVDVVALQAVVGELALLGREPAGCQRRVGEEGVRADGDETGD